MMFNTYLHYVTANTKVHDSQWIYKLITDILFLYKYLKYSW